MPMMKAAIFVEPGRIVLEDKPIPDVGACDALLRITTTTIRGTDIHILKGEYPVARRLTIGHEPVGIIEKLGSAVTGYPATQATFEGALRVLRPGGTLTSLGVYSTDVKIPLDAFAAGLAGLKIVTTLCPGGKERMRRLMSVIASRRLDLKPLLTHRFKPDQIDAAYDLFGHQRDGVLKVVITP